MLDHGLITCIVQSLHKIPECYFPCYFVGIYEIYYWYNALKMVKLYMPMDFIAVPLSILQAFLIY